MITSRLSILKTVAFLDLLAAGLIVPQVPNHARLLGCNHVIVGLIGALYSGFQLVSGPLTGSLTDDGGNGKKTILLVTLSLSGIAYVFLGLTSSIILFLGLRAFLGVFKHTQLLTRAIALDYVSEKNQISETHGKLETLSGIGLLLGPIIGGFIMETLPDFGFTLIALIVGSIFAVNSVLIQKLPEETKRKNKSEAKSKQVIAPKLLDSITNSVKSSVQRLYKIDWNIYSDAFLLQLLVSLCMGVYVCNYALYLKIQHQVTPKTLGFVTSLLWATGSFFTYHIGYINKYYEDDKDYTERNYHVFLTITLSLLGMLLAPNLFVYVICIVPFAVSCTVAKLAILEVMLSKTSKDQQGLMLGVANNVRSVTGVVAPMVAGVIGEYIGILYIIHFCILLGGVGTYASYVLRIRNYEVKTKKD